MIETENDVRLQHENVFPSALSLFAVLLTK